MLKRLFTSNVRIKLLQIFLNNPKEEYFIRELTRLLDEQINSIRRELDNLKKVGLLTYKTKDRKKYYTVNHNFIFLQELTTIFGNKNDTYTELVTELQKLDSLDLVVLTGSFINDQNSPVDLLVVGDVDKSKFANLLESLNDTSIRFSLMPKEDFIYRLNLNDQFIINVISNKKNIIPINNLDLSLKDS